MEPTSDRSSQLPGSLASRRSVLRLTTRVNRYICKAMYELSRAFILSRYPIITLTMTYSHLPKGMQHVERRELYESLSARLQYLQSFLEFGPGRSLTQHLRDRLF